MNRIFSGVQPTGNLHLGNYLGAIRNWVNLQDQYDCYFCLVDLHAITVWQNPEELIKNTREVTAGLLASGLDPAKNTIFIQSQVPGHAELAWILNCVSRMGWLNRMTQFKEKAGKNRENASVGLFAYPNLMAADILLYQTTHVPVGEDQKQHLELTRNIAQKFNKDFKVDFFPIVEPLIFGAATRVMSLRNGLNKMSKSDISDYSRINMTDTEDEIVLKIRKAKTDSYPLPGNISECSNRPEALNLLGIYAGFSDQNLDQAFNEHGGKSFADFKKTLTDLLIAKLLPIQKKTRQLNSDITYLDSILKNGNEKAREVSDIKLQKIKKIIGFHRP